MDEMGFVYEKDAVFHWLSSQPGAGRSPVRAPIAGEAFLASCTHPMHPEAFYALHLQSTKPTVMSESLEQAGTH